MVASDSQRNRRGAEMPSRPKKKKSRKSSKKTPIIISIVSIIVLIILIILSFTVFFNVSSVTSVGSKVYTPEQVVRASGIKAGDNLLSLSESVINDKLTKMLPFIKSVKLERHFPDKVALVITDAKEQISFFSSEKHFSADLEGKVLKEYTEQPDNTVLVTVADKTQLSAGSTVVFSTDREKELYELFTSLLNDSAFKINFINIKDPYNAYMKIDGRVIVKLGSSSYFDKKIDYLKASLSGISKDAKGVFDLSLWSPDNNKPIFSHTDISDYEF